MDNKKSLFDSPIYGAKFSYVTFDEFSSKYKTAVEGAAEPTKETEKFEFEAKLFNEQIKAKVKENKDAFATLVEMFTEKDGDDMAAKWDGKSKGKWIPKTKNGKLVADGGIVRRHDSDVPDECQTTLEPNDLPVALSGEDYKKLQDAKFSIEQFKKDMKIPVAPIYNKEGNQYFDPFGHPLTTVKSCFNKALSSAKASTIPPPQFAMALKGLTDAASGIVPFHVAKAVEKSAIDEYYKYWFASALP